MTISKNTIIHYRLSTTRPLDREQIANYSLTILATEDCIATPNYQADVDSVSTLNVQVTVNDVNDNSPKFVSKIFTGGITTEADFGIEFMHVKVNYFCTYIKVVYLYES